MPLRDHFRPPLSQIASWEGLHGGWPMVIVQQLAETLPPNYIAEPRVHLGTQVEIDVATFDQESGTSGFPRTERPGETAATWSPVEPTLTVETELADFDEYEVRVYDVGRGRRLVAAVEIVSPANKDRSENRHQFTAKCAALLRQGVSVIVVDLVTARSFNLYCELLQLIGQNDPALGDQPPPTYAAACRWRPRGKSHWLDVWNHTLVLGQPLPCLPLWLTDELAVSLDLEASYEKACRDLRLT